MPSGTGVTSDNIPIQTAGITAYIATDYVGTGGITGHYQLIKLGYGVDGSATVVNSSNPLPVTIATGMTATISGFTGTIDVRGVGGAAVVVSGSVVTTGLTSSPLWVKTYTGSQVEVTGGRYLGKSTDSISVWGPSGLTYIYAHLVTASGNSLSYTNGALNVNVTGATINATIPSTVTVVGLSGATAVNAIVGNTVGIYDTNIVNGLTAIYAAINTLNTNLGTLGISRPTTFISGRSTVTTGVTGIYPTGYTTISGINMKASSANTDIIYINSDGVAAIGYELDPGENIFLNVKNLNTIYIRAKTSSQIISYMAS
jgi:hypothetical protein